MLLNCRLASSNLVSAIEPFRHGNYRLGQKSLFEFVIDIDGCNWMFFFGGNYLCIIDFRVNVHIMKSLENLYKVKTRIGEFGLSVKN